MPMTPIPSATILLLRDGADGPEIFMLRRREDLGFAGGALVFPGGKLASGDADAALLMDGADALAPDLRPLAAAAIREAFEESGILLARRAGRLLSGGEAASLDGFRAPLDREDIMLSDFLRGNDLRLAADLLVPFAHWITPAFVPRRFDTYFFAANAPAGQLAAHDGGEAVESLWIAPKVALAKFARADLMMPTRLNLELLVHCRTSDEALAQARARKIVPVEPWVEERGGRKMIVIPKDAGYGEIAVPFDSER